MAGKRGRAYACPSCGRHRVWDHTLEQVRACHAQREAVLKARRIPAPRQTRQALVQIPEAAAHPFILTEGTVNRLQGNQRGGLKNRGHRWTSEQARAAALQRYRHPHTGRVYQLARTSWVRDLPAVRAHYVTGRVVPLGSQLALIRYHEGTVPFWTIRLGETGEERPLSERRVLFHLGLAPDRHKKKHVASLGVPVSTRPLPSPAEGRARARARLQRKGSL